MRFSEDCYNRPYLPHMETVCALRRGEYRIAEACAAARVRFYEGNAGRVCGGAVGHGIRQVGDDECAVHRRVRPGIEQGFQGTHIAQVFAGEDDGVRVRGMAAQFGQEITRGVVAAMVAAAQAGVVDDGFAARAQDGAAVRGVVVACRGEGGDKRRGKGEREPERRRGEDLPVWSLQYHQ